MYCSKLLLAILLFFILLFFVLLSFLLLIVVLLLFTSAANVFLSTTFESITLCTVYVPRGAVSAEKMSWQKDEDHAEQGGKEPFDENAYLGRKDEQPGQGGEYKGTNGWLKGKMLAGWAAVTRYGRADRYTDATHNGVGTARVSTQRTCTCSHMLR